MSAPVAPIGGTPGTSANDASRTASRANLEAAGARFEAIFTGMMLKSMRSASLGSGLFDNKAGEQFRDMFDDRIAQSMAQSAPMGIGRAMTEFLARGAGDSADAAGEDGTP